MLNVRKHYVEQSNTLTDTGMHTINIDVDKPISAIEFVIKATNGSTSNTGQKLVDAIKSIEVLNGSDKLMSLNGYELVSYCYHAQVVKPVMIDDTRGGGVQQITLTYLFGQHLGDKNHYLNPADFNNLQVRIQTDLTIDASAGFATGTASASTVLYLIENDANSSNGFIMTKNEKSWTTAASGDERTDLPTDHDYLGIMIMSREDTTLFETAITNVKLSINSDSMIPIDAPSADLVQEAKSGCRPFTYDAKLVLAHDGVYLSPTWSEPFISPVATADGIIPTIKARSGNSITMNLLDASTPGTPADAGATNMVFVGSGYVPFGSIYLDLKDKYTLAPYKVNPKDNIKLILTQGNADGDGRIIISSLRTR